MQFFSSIYLIYCLASIGVLAWFAMDMRSILKAAQRKNHLEIEGRWEDLDEHFKRTSKTWRPFVRFHYRYLLPGADSAQYALFLYKHGRLEEALAKMDLAIRRIKGKPKIFWSIHNRETYNILCAALRGRVLILTGMGRYDEARQVVAELQRITKLENSTNSALALLEYYCGRLDEALALAEAVPIRDKQYDSMRNITALAYEMKGEFDNAIRALLYEPSDMSKFYSAEGLKTMNQSPEGPKLVELQNKKLAGIFQPIRLILLASVYLSKEEFQNADYSLDEAEKSLGPEPVIQMSYCRHRARSFAAQGKAAEAERYIERVRTIVQQRPKRSTLWETHYTVAKSYLSLGRFSDALAELTEAERFVLHPIEKHSTAYLIARTHEAAGDRNKAIPYYQVVVADTIPSWMRKRAAEALDGPKS